MKGVLVRYNDRRWTYRMGKTIYTIVREGPTVFRASDDPDRFTAWTFIHGEDVYDVCEHLEDASPLPGSVVSGAVVAMPKAQIRYLNATPGSAPVGGTP